MTGERNRPNNKRRKPEENLKKTGYCLKPLAKNKREYWERGSPRKTTYLNGQRG